MLFLSAVFAVLSGILLTENVDSVDGKGIVIYGIGSIFLGVLGSLGVSKTNKKINFWYLFIVFTIAGFIGGMSRYFVPYNDGLMIIIIALTFLVFFIIGRSINKKVHPPI